MAKTIRIPDVNKSLEDAWKIHSANWSDNPKVAFINNSSRTAFIEFKDFPETRTHYKSKLKYYGKIGIICFFILIAIWVVFGITYLIITDLETAWMIFFFLLIGFMFSMMSSSQNH